MGKVFGLANNVEMMDAGQRHLLKSDVIDRLSKVPPPADQNCKIRNMLIVFGLQHQALMPECMNYVAKLCQPTNQQRWQAKKRLTVISKQRLSSSLFPA